MGWWWETKHGDSGYLRKYHGSADGTGFDIGL